MALDSVTAVALVISLVALVISLAQLLAQVVGTVDGYRRCQKPVMREWARFTRFRWSLWQFRFYTTFRTPHIMLGDFRLCENGSLDGMDLLPEMGWLARISGSIENFRWEAASSLFPRGKDKTRLSWLASVIAGEQALEDRMSELVCWVPLLDRLTEVTSRRDRALLGAGDKLDTNDEKPSTQHSAFTRRQIWSLNHWNKTQPGVRAQSRSWDYMPPDQIKPFATTDVTAISVLACRIGVRWKAFSPAEGIMEGQSDDGDVFSATRVRGLGTMLACTYLGATNQDRKVRSAKAVPYMQRELPKTYRDIELFTADEASFLSRREGVDQREQREEDVEQGQSRQHGSLALKDRFIHSEAGDMLWYGLLPCNLSLCLPSPSQVAARSRSPLYFRLSTAEGIAETLTRIDTNPERRALINFQIMQKRYPGYMHGVCDIVPLVSPWLRVWNTRINCYPQPWKSTKGLTRHGAAYQVFSGKLKNEYLSPDVPEQIAWVNKMYDQLSSKWDKQWEWDGFSAILRPDQIQFYNELELLYNATTQYFRRIQRENGLHYMDLVAAHLREAPRSLADAEWRLDNGQAESHIDTSLGDKRWRGEAMMMYFAYMPDYEAYLKGKFTPSEDNPLLVREAWITMMFRAFLWMRAHEPIDDFPLIPSQYWGSKMPIYIA